MKIVIHQTHHTIGDFDAIYNNLEACIKKAKKGELHLFPEMYLSCYALQDLVLQAQFIDDYSNLYHKVDKLFKESESLECDFLIGGIHYELTEQDHLPKRIENVIFHAKTSQSMQKVYVKQLLPNYDIFDEKKYYDAGSENSIINIQGKNVALLICEDMWSSGHHKTDPILNLLGNKIDLTVNLSASPFDIEKRNKRVQRSLEISHNLKSPFIYVNCVGAEDEILFDGGSFIQDGDDTIEQMSYYKEQIATFEMKEKRNYKKYDLTTSDSWSHLFSTRIKNNNGILKLKSLSEEDCCQIIESIGFGLKEYADKTGNNSFLIALSGGIDSAICLALAKLSLPPTFKIEAVYMPSKFSSTLSYDLCVEICKNLNVPLKILPIKFPHTTLKNQISSELGIQLNSLSDENIQSRLRGLLIYTLSNQTNSLVINTSNKSEIAVGYSTLYGDSVGAISLIGDLYKSEVFQVSNYINKVIPNSIPQEIIDRKPSAELRENQLDSDSLPDYEILDPIIEALLSSSYSAQRLYKYFDNNSVDKVYKLINRSEYKRRQFCPIIKLKTKSFGFGHRMPICKKN